MNGVRSIRSRWELADTPQDILLGSRQNDVATIGANVGEYEANVKRGSFGRRHVDRGQIALCTASGRLGYRGWIESQGRHGP